MKDMAKIKLSLTGETYRILKRKAGELGVPVTQYIKHIVLTELEDRPSDTKLNQTENDLDKEKDDLDRLLNNVRRVKLRLSAIEAIRNKKRKS